jgi:hypothetical protein
MAKAYLVSCHLCEAPAGGTRGQSALTQTAQVPNTLAPAR